MNPVLNLNNFFVKEHTGIFKAANNFDILDPTTQKLILTCREEQLGTFTKMLRFTDYKRMTPFHVEIKTPDGKKIITVKRGISIILSTVEVLDENDKTIGFFKQKFFSIGGKFDVLDVNNQVVCTLKGKWTSWDFRFMQGETELAHVSKKWAGIGKEMFTSADNYMLEIKPATPQNSPIREMIMAAVLCIDMVLKE
ncbi:MAG: phospholipid scramblase-related protein [Bacteroidota bacterium]|nr:phospholipid scramblase-related protein [Bacteroidota bacterium]